MNKLLVFIIVTNAIYAMEHDITPTPPPSPKRIAQLKNQQHIDEYSYEFYLNRLYKNMRAIYQEIKNGKDECDPINCPNSES